MLEKIGIPVLAALATAFAFWILSKAAIIPSLIQIPQGGVVAFDLQKCPKVGWAEYKPAHGRFVRGLDRSGTKIDPEADTRKLGSLQGDAIQRHTHTTNVHAFGHEYNDGGRPNQSENNDGKIISVTSSNGEDASFSDESRPKNVALLYCIKL